MADASFDTLSTASDLKNAGIDPAHAEAIARGIGAAVTGGGLVTRMYLDKRLAELRTQMLTAQLVTALAIIGAIKYL